MVNFRRGRRRRGALEPGRGRPQIACADIDYRRSCGRRRTRRALQLLVADQQPERAASDKRCGKRIFADRRHQTVEKTGLRAAHRTIPFMVSLSFSSCRMVSCGARLRESSLLIPIANSAPAITAATTAEVK